MERMVAGQEVLGRRTTLLIVTAVVLAVVLDSAAYAAPESQLPLASAKAAAAKSERTILGVVVDHEDNPVAGAELTWQLWTCEERLTANAKTDRTGQFRILPPPLGRGNAMLGPGWVWVVTPQKQLSAFSLSRDSLRPDASPLRFKLQQPDSLQVTVRDPEGKPLAGAGVTVNWRRIRDADGHSLSSAVPDVVANRILETTNDHGVAVLPGVSPLEADGLRVTTVKFGQQVCSYVDPSEQLAARDITLRPAGRVKGRLVADSPDAIRGRRITVTTWPDTGAQVRSTRSSGTAEVVTDEQGQFDIRVIAGGKVRINVETSPRDRYYPVKLHSEVGILEAGREITVELPLEPGIHVRGVLHESGSGKSLPGIGVMYPLPVGEYSLKLSTVIPGPDGQFEFFCLPAWYSQFRTGLSLSPIPLDGDRRTFWCWSTECSPETHLSSEHKAWEVPPIELTRLQGRVVNEAGKPISGATIGSIFCEADSREGVHTFELRNAHGTTDAEGRFVAWGNPSRRLRMMITSPGMVAHETGWIQLTQTPVNQLPDVVLKPFSFRAITGRVIDRQGNPVVGAKVYQTISGPKPTETTTDHDGKFRLEGVSEDGAFVFVEREGFRFSGHVVEGTPTPVDLVVARSSEPPRRILKTVPLPRAERLALARQVLEPLMQSTKPERISKTDVLTTLAKIDPEQARQLVAKEPREAQAELLVSVSLASGVKPSIEMIDAVSDPMDKAFLVMRTCTGKNLLPKEEALELLQKVADETHAAPVPDPECRPMLMAMFAEGLFRLGARESSGRLLHEAESLVRESPPSCDECSAWGFVAQRLALVDLSASLKMIQAIPDDVADYSLASVACRLAEHNPLEAERVLGMIKQQKDTQSLREAVAVLVCKGLASVDLKRARRLADTLTSPLSCARAYAAMAMAVAEEQPAEAATLLHQASKALSRARSLRSEESFSDPELVTLAAAVVGIAEQINPQLVDEHLWHCVSLCNPLMTDTPALTNGVPSSDRLPSLTIAALVAYRYDPPLGERLSRAVQAWASPGSRATLDERFVSMMVALDPKQAVAELDRIADMATRVKMRVRVAWLLASNDEAFWNRVLSYKAAHLTLEPEPWDGDQ